MSADRVPLPAGQLRVVLGVSRARVLPLRLAYEADEQVRVVSSCTTASEVLAALERGDAEGAILDEDLHGLDRARLGVLKERQWRVVLLSRQPESARWDGLPGAVLHVESDPSTSCTRCAALPPASPSSIGGPVRRRHAPHASRPRRQTASNPRPAGRVRGRPRSRG